MRQNCTTGIFLHTGRCENYLMIAFSVFKCSSTMTIKFSVLSTFLNSHSIPLSLSASIYECNVLFLYPSCDSLWLSIQLTESHFYKTPRREKCQPHKLRNNRIPLFFFEGHTFLSTILLT